LHRNQRMEPIAEIIRRVLSRKGLEKGIKEAEVLGKWPQIAGTVLANHAEAVAIEKGILFLRVMDSAWRNELSLLSEELIKKINDDFGEKRVNRIHLI